MARRATVILDVEEQEARASLERVEGDLESVEVAARGAGEGFDRMSDAVTSEMAEARQQIERTADSQEEFRRGASNANQAVFALGDGLADAATVQGDFSTIARAAGNNMAFFAENMADTAQNAGGFGAALSQLKNSIFGVGGLLLGLQAVIALGPRLASMFSDSSEAADDAKQSFEELSDAIADFSAIEVAGLRIGPSDLTPAIRALQERRQTLRLRIEGLQDRLTQLQERAGTGAAAQALFQQQTQEIRNQLNELQKRDEDAQKFIQKLRTERSIYQRQLDLRRHIRDATGLTVDQTTEAANQAEREADATERTLNALEQVGAIQESRNVQLLQGMQRRGVIGTQAPGVPGFRPGGLFPSRGAIGMMGMTSRGIGQARARTRALRGSIAGLTDLGILPQFKSFEQIMSNVGDDSDEISRALEQTADVFASGMSQAAIALAEGADSAKVLNQVLKEAAKTLTRMIIKKGIVALLNAMSGGTAGAAAGAGQAVQGAVGTTLAKHGVENFEGGLVRLHPPEMVLPPGSNVVSQKETKRLLAEATTGGPQSGAVVNELRNLRRDVNRLQLRADERGLHLSVSEAQGEKARTGATTYPEI